MNSPLFLSFVFILASMALLMITSIQKQLVLDLNRRVERQERGLMELDKEHLSMDLLKASLERLLVRGREELRGLEAALTSFGPAIEETKTKIDACQAAKHVGRSDETNKMQREKLDLKKNLKNTINDELVGAEKTNAEAKDAFKPESDAWKQQIDTLNAQLTGHRSICDYVKDDPTARKLCS